MKQRNWIASTLLLAALAVGSGAWAQEATAPPAEPTPAPPKSLDEALAVAVVGDVEGFIRSLGTVSRQIMPTLTGTAVKAQVGQFVQDPTLEGLPAGSGLAVLVFPSNVSAAFIEVAPAKVDSYLAALKGQGHQAEKADGVLVAATDANSLSACKPFASKVKAKYLRGAGKPSLKLTMHSQKVLPVIEGPLRQGVKSIGMLVGQMQAAQGAASPGSAKSTQNLLEAQALGLVAMLKQTKTLGLELQIASAIQLSLDLEATDGSDLSRFLAAPCASPESILKMLPADGGMRGVTSYNAAALESLVKKLADQVFKEMALSPEEKKSFEGMIAQNLGMGGDGVYAMDMLVPGKTALNGCMLTAYSNEAEMLKQLEALPLHMESASQLTASAGQTLKAQLIKNARKHNDVAIHQLRVNLQFPADVPAEMRKMTELFGKFEYDVAFVDKVAIYAMGGVPIDPMIDAVKAKAHPGAQPLKAQSVFGPKAKSYADLDPAKMMQWGVGLAQSLQAGAPPAPGQLNPADMLNTMATMLGSSDPVTAAGFWGDGNEARMTLSIPSGLVGKVAQFGMMAQQAMSAGSGAPQPGAPAPGQPQPAQPPQNPY